MSKYYTGVGSRETPAEILTLMGSLARTLSKLGYTLRSGGADGADSAFGDHAALKDVYLPWKNFNNKQGIVVEGSALTAAFSLAAQIHPAWERCSHGAKALHARNCFQVLGPNLDNPSEFLICWTPGGRVQGGTATAINLALKHGVKVYNLATQADYDALRSFLQGLIKTHNEGQDK